MFGRNNTISEIYSKINAMRLWYGRIHDHITKWLQGNGGKYDHLRKYVPLCIMIFLYMSSFLFPASASAVSTAERQNIWVAYTVGDVSFIHSVLRAISMIMYGGGGVIQGAYRLAALLGIIWLIVRGIFCKEGINIGSGLFVIIFYMCFFVPQSTLHIEDLQTKKFYVMDKIPLGVSVTLSVTSKIGKYLSEAYETVFTEASEDSAACTIGSMECNGYLGTLDMLLYSRSNLQNAAAYIAINKALCGSSLNYEDCNIEMSLTNYVRDCTMQKVISPSENFALQNVKSFKGDNTKYDLFYDSERTRVNVYLGRLGKGSMTCKKAGLQIEQAFLNSRVKSTIYWLATHKKNMTPHDGGMVNDGGTGVDNGMPEGNYDYAAMEGNFQSMITGLDPQMGDSYTYLKNVMIQPLMENGLRNGFIDQNIAAGQIALDNAKAQRDIQLAAESSMFASMIRPLTTFFEGFVLAITPLMPFLLLLSLNTFGLVMKYLLVLFWIQLWAPALAICNMYIQNIAREDIAMAVAGGDLTSMVGITRSATVVQHWLGVGGMMAASVPILTLFILTGSVYAFTNLAASIKGGDHFDEKAIQPDAINRPAYINDSVGAFNANSGAGIIKDGTQARFKMYSWQDLSQRSEQSAHTESIEAGRQFVHSFAEAWNNSKTGQISGGLIKNIGHALQSGQTYNYEKGRSVLDTWSKQHGTTMSDTDANLVMAAAMLKGGAGIEEILDVGGEVKGSRSLSAILGKNFNTSLDDIYNTLQGTKDTAMDSDTVAKTLSSLSQENLTQGLQQLETGSITDSYNKFLKKQDAYQKAISRTNSSSSTQQMSSNNIAAKIIENRSKTNSVLDWFKNNKDVYNKIYQNAQDKGFEHNTSGIFSAAVEYALDNSNTDAKADELRKVMGLDNIKENVNNNVNANPVNDIQDNKDEVQKKLNQLNQSIQKTQAEREEEYNNSSAETGKKIKKGEKEIDKKGGNTKGIVIRQTQDMDNGGVAVVGRNSGEVLNENLLAYEKARLIQAIEGTPFKYSYDDITQVEVLENGNKVVHFPDGYSLELKKYDPYHKPKMDLIDYIPSMNIPGTTGYTPDGQDIKRGEIWIQGDSNNPWDAPDKLMNIH